MMPSVGNIESILMTCYSWNSAVPWAKSASYEDCKKFYEQERTQALYIFKSILDKSEEMNGNERAMEIWQEMRGPMIKADWTKGPIRIFRAIYRRASMVVQQRHENEPKRVGEILERSIWRPKAENIFQ